ncbi:MAG: hypothetical protein PWQ88_300 [Candidatus Methanomethylophilaceae archaeon]|nr:hypothetical protein [Candidatus Methanomethylophilaceae archaeon]MDI3542016.1 hypothetical protein [Candidatus Methanomethylophilaceae archaeon]HIJ00862.1 hypothetical protein [Candidatus Methanomethylophilaceae archaeon]
MIGSLAKIAGYGPLEWGKVYCNCGNIIDLDRGVIIRKRSLGKPIECSVCRNRRIAKEIEELNNHFLGEDEED